MKLNKSSPKMKFGEDYKKVTTVTLSGVMNAPHPPTQGGRLIYFADAELPKKI